MWPFKTKVKPKIRVIDPIKRTKYSSETDEIVSNLFQGKYYFFKSLELVNFKDGIDWNYRHHKGEKTYQTYLHSLEIIHHLCNHYEKKKDKKSLQKAYEILTDWAKHDSTAGDSKKERSYRYRWGDHASATRALAIIYFYTLAKNVIRIDEEIIYELLVKHAQFLNDDSNYNKNNHGVMVDRALVSISLMLPEHPESERWKEKAIYRLREAFNRDFSYKGVHLENSPDYHSMVRRLFQTAEAFLNKYKLTLGNDIVEMLELTEDYFQNILKPNKILPYIGDTSSGKLKKEKKYDNFVDVEAGIAILQQQDVEDPEKSTWLSFISGYGSKTHKHQDDLSINLYYNGNDIFVDSGKYNYAKKDKIRIYMISPIAHNTLAIEGQTYKIANPMVNRDKIRITGYHSTFLYDMVKGENTAYEGASLARTVVFLKPNILVIFDEAESKETQKFLQVFNLAPHIEIIETKDNYAKIKSGDDVVEFQQILGTSTVESFEADRDLPRAVMSERFNQLTDISQLEFSKKGKEAQFVTVIKMGNESSLKDVTFDENIRKITLDKDGEKIDIYL